MQQSSDLGDEMVPAWLALGANLGDAVQTVCAAMDAIQHWPQTRVAAASSLYRTAPVDATGPDFINAVVQIATRLRPEALLAQCQQAEAAAG
ncbi:MAG: 2-amino-4-hydroxy-6-hydroxymethyldihydropteridine diphosphokinase, partial [Brachymonas sp.]|nr:2-amino-4-hydroxy-6-hydroxymethyldihydropteridine diphosphokinase [Brachymonas sp.]